MTGKISIAVVAAALVAAPAAIRADDTSTTSNAPKAARAATPEASKVLAQLQHANVMEIEMGKLAKSNSDSDSVKQYGEELVKDHKDAQDKTESVAKELGVKLPSQSNTLAGMDHAKMNQLKELKGAAFDKAFAEAMQKDHSKAIAQFETAQKSLTGPAADLVSQVLPVLKKHQQDAKQLTMNPAGSSGKTSTATQ